MKNTRATDIFLHVFFPLCAGFFLYYGAGEGWVSLPVKNYMPDGLWSYAFIAALLIAWDRTINRGWIVIAISSLLLFEGLQLVGLITGTGDLLDILVYLAFAALALFVNRFLKDKYTENCLP